MTVLDLRHATGLEFPAPDVCIVGAGAAGITLASQLVGQGKRVVVLEGGGRDLEPSSQSLYQSDIIGHPHVGIHNGRYRTFGGTTTKWGGQVLELDDEDFAVRPWIPGSGWPFAKRELGQYYARALVAEGITEAAGSETEVWRQLGLKRPDYGADLVGTFSRWLPDPDFTTLFKASLETSDRLMVYLHANALQLILDANVSRVVAVRCRTPEGREARFPAQSFVLCMGGIETIRFMLQPSNRYPWEQNALLGQNFQDHVAATCGDMIIHDWAQFRHYFSNAWIRGLKYQPKLKLAAAFREREMLLGATAVPMFDEDESLLRLKALAKNVVRGRLSKVTARGARDALGHLPTLARHAWEFKRHGRAYHSRGTPIHLNVSCEQEPRGRSRIYLSHERDALGLFRVVLDWHVSDLELRTLSRCTELVDQVLSAKGIARVIPDNDLLGDPGRIRLHCYDSNHHMGGARMGHLPAEGVVDAELRINGVDNAYVCSTAVFPTSGSSNPTHTLLALAIRLSDALVRESARRVRTVGGIT